MEFLFVSILDVLKEFITEIVIAIGGIFAWKRENKRANTANAILKEELEKDKNSNYHTLMSMYKDALKDSKEFNDIRFAEFKEEIDSLKKKLARSQQDYATLKRAFLEDKNINL